MSTTKPSTPLTELDFDTIKNDLKTFLLSQSQFKDADYDGSNMSVLLDVLSYNTYINNFYTNMAISEMFLDSAQIRGSVISHAKELNYLPHSIKSSSATIDVDINAIDSPPFVVIPKYTSFTSTIGTKQFNFVNLETSTVMPDSNGKYIFNGLRVVEGKIVTESNLVSAGFTKFLISNKDADISTLTVFVRETTDPSSSRVEYIKKDSLFGVKANDKVFFIQPFDENTYEVTFGVGIFGFQPLVGNVIEFVYLVSKGADANGVSSLAVQSSIGGYSASVSVTSVSAGGTERESIESIKFNAPKSIQIQDRAVTENDYEILLENNFPEIQSVSVYGGEKKTPPQYGRSIVVVDVKNSDGVSENNKVKYQKFLKNRCPLSIEPVIESPGFVYVDVITSVSFDDTKTTKTPSDIKNDVAVAIKNYSNIELNNFKTTLRYSKLLNAIDNADVSILSNTTEIKAIIDLSPKLNIINYFSFSFNQPLSLEKALWNSASLSKYKSAIASSSFVYGGNLAHMLDDGEGNIHIFQSSGAVVTILKKNVGTVDYTTGEIIIQDFIISEYTPPAIKIYARTRDNNIQSPQGRIIRIRDNVDVVIDIVGVAGK